MLFSVVSFQKYGFPKGILRNVTCIRVITILTLIRQLCKPILHESEIKLHEFRANRQTFLRGHNEENALLAGAFDECRDNEKTCF